MSKRNLIILIGIIGGLLILFLLALSFSKSKTDWNKKFGQTNKAPFGYYVLYKELKLLTDAKSLHEVKDLGELDHLNPETDAVFIISENPYSSTIIKDKLKTINKKDITVFYAATNEISNVLTADKPIITKVNNVESQINLNRYTQHAKIIQAKDLKTLGTVKINDSIYTNYHLVKNNKLKIYTHEDPILFSNFYLFEKDGYKYAKEVLKPLNNKNIYWINPSKNYYSQNNDSALSFILSQPELKAAWYVLLICLFLYLFFKSKREQKIIPIVNPEQNLSLEFANVIASMYYESGKPADIIKKQIDYFLYKIRKQFNVITEDVFNEHFIYILAQKAQITKEEALEMMKELHQLYNKPKAELKDVNRTYHIIENYKKKAQIL